VKVVALPKKVSKDVIRHLEEMTARAKAGEITAYAMCATCDDGTMMHSIVGLSDVQGTLGLLARLQHRVNFASDRNCIDPNPAGPPVPEEEEETT
jgi:hypothetical protein